MEVDEIQRQVSKFQRVSSNGSSTTTTTDHNLILNNHKIATSRGNQEVQNHHHHVDDSGVIGGGGGVGVGGGIARLCGWPSSRIVRVSRASGGKDRHSKVLTSKGLRDRRVRLSVSTAIQFYDLQDRLGFDQPSKAVEWLLKAAASSIDELPSLDPSFSGVISEQCHDNRVQVDETKKLNENCNDFEDLNFHHQVEQHQQQNDSNNNKNDVISEVKWKAQSKSNSKSKSPDCSSTSETSKGSGLSLSRSENRMKARERAREMASKKEKNIALNHTLQTNISENSSFTDLLTSGINTSVRRSPESRNHWSTTQPPPPQPMDYFFGRPPQFNITAIDNHHHHHHNHFSFLQDSFIPTAVPTTTGGGNGESYNLNFSMTSSSSASGGVALAPGFSRGTLQSNLPYLQRFQSSSSIDGSPSTNLPFFIVPNNVSDHFPATTGGYHLSYGGGGGGDHHHKDKPKN